MRTIKSRWLWFWLCIILALMLLAGGLLVPAHLRALDSSVVQAAGRSGVSLLDRGKTLAATGRLGAAQLYAPAARLAEIPGWDRFGEMLTNLVRSTPSMAFWGDDTRTPAHFESTPAGSFASFIVRGNNRGAALAALGRSNSSAVQELLHTRELNTLSRFAPSATAAGQVFDAAVAETGLLLDDGAVTTTFNDNILTLALHANRGNGTEPLEEVLEDFVSLGERFNWDQLRAFVAHIPDATTLHQLATAARSAGDRLPVLFVAVQLSDDPAAVGKYLTKFNESGLQDIAQSLCYGADGVRTLVERGQRFYQPDWRHVVVQREPFASIYYFTANLCLHHARLMLAVKWFCYLAAGFLLAMAMHVGRPPVTPLEQPLQVPGAHLFRESLFALGFLLVVLLLSEPFLAQERPEGAVAFRLQLPMTGVSVAAGIAGLKQTVMNPTILLTMLLFFVLQALIYLACLLKLAEIRRQQVPPRIKLKLLENEEHLFDAGLYLGFVGTIISLILASMGKVHFSLMAAYSATCFGIIFVIVFKIFHLRPARRQLLLEAEAEAATTAIPSTTVP